MRIVNPYPRAGIATILANGEASMNVGGIALWDNLTPMNPKRSTYDSAPPSGHKVSPERLEEFRRIHKEVYGKEITLQDATAMAHRLLALYELLLRPLPGGQAPHPVAPEPPAQTAPEAS